MSARRDDEPPRDAAHDALADTAVASTERAPPAGDGAVLTAEHAGRYTPGAELGRGGMGRVVIAFDRHIGREVALKELLSAGDDAGVDGASLARFVREARVTGQLEHPGVVPVYELGQRADGTVYYTMKRVRGRSLASLLRQCRAPADRLKLLSVFRDVCQAVAYAHARGVVHRDLKPDNVMVGEFGETLVVDWGLAAVRGEDDPRAPEVQRRIETLRDAAQTLEGAALGTPAYMAPEQARGELSAIDERSDVWGLGAILFELLTGRTPFTGASALEVLAAVLTRDPPRVRAVAPDSPPALAAIADRALSPDRARRYASARELATEVAAWQDDRPVRAYEYSSWELLRRFVRRNRAATLASALVLAATLAAAALVYRSYRAELRERRVAERARDEARAGERETRVALASALLERAERALHQGDRAAAAVYAAAALARDPAFAPEASSAGLAPAERDRIARAYSTYVEADGGRRWEFVRRIEATTGSALAGSRVVSPSADGLRIEDVRTGAREDVVVPGVDHARFAVALDEGRVLLAQRDATLVVDLSARAVTARLPASLAAVVGGERVFVVLLDGDVSVRARADLAELDRFATGGEAVTPNPLASADGAQFGVRSTTGLFLWRLPRTEAPRHLATGAMPRAAAFSPDGRLVAVPRFQPSVPIYDTDTLSLRRELYTESGSGAAPWLDEARLALADDASNTIALRGIDATTPDEVLHALPAQTHFVHRVGDLLVDLPQPLPDRAARGGVYRALSRSGDGAIALPTSVTTLLLDAPRGRVVVATNDAVRVFDLAGRPLSTLPVAPEYGRPADLALASDGAVVAITTGGAVLLAELDATSLRVLVPAGRDRLALPALALSRDGDVVFASSPADGAIVRCSRSRGLLPPLTGHTRGVYGLALSPDEHTLASASLDGTLRLWHLGEGARSEVLARQEHLFSHVAFSPEGGRLAAGDGDGWLSVYASGRAIARARIHDRWINRVAWWPDGRWIVSASDDATARITSADLRTVDRIVRCAGSCAGIAPVPAGDALYVQRELEVARVPLEPGRGTRDPVELLRSAERRAGVRLDALDLLPLP